jgi:hypothetical protein
MFSFSCSTYKRIDYNEKRKQTQLDNTAVVVLKESGFILLKDKNGWYEQTFHKPTVKKYNIGDTVIIKN